jgi:hyaluronan synthase
VYLDDLVERGVVHGFIAFFAFVWLLWLVKAAVAGRYHAFPVSARTADLRASVIVPVFSEPPELFRRVLASVRENEPHELIVVVDGADPFLAHLARDYADQVLPIPKQGKRVAIQVGLGASDPGTEVVVVLDSDTIWAPNLLRELLLPFADPRVGGVTPRQAVFDRNGNAIRRLADWIEDIRYRYSVPAQSVLGQIGCLAGRTIGYRRAAFEPAVERLVRQRVLGVEMSVGDDRVLTNEILRSGWRTVYQSTAQVWTDTPSTWRKFWAQQLRWGRSSQRETLLSLGWLWQRPFALLCFLSDIVIPFWLYTLFALTASHALLHVPSPMHLPISAQLAIAYGGMLASIGVRQIPHFRRYPGDIRYLPLFVLQLTFFMAPTRIAAFATMFHNSWRTRTAPAMSVAHADVAQQAASDERQLRRVAR